MNKHNALLPCPWCGLVPNEVGYSVWGTYHIECESDDCAVQPLTEAYVDKAEAIAAWNTRKGRERLK